MNGILNEKVIVKEYNFNKKSPIQKIGSLIDNAIRDCHAKYFHTFDHICEYNLNFTNITKNETVNFTISDKSMGMYDLNQKLAIARGNNFIFNQKNKLTIKIYSNLTHINRCYFLKHRIRMCHRLLFWRISQNLEYIQTSCNVSRNPFLFACRQWYLYNNPQCDMV